MRSVHRALITLVLALATVMGPLPGPTASADPTDYPVVLVFGAFGTSFQFDQMRAWLTADGYRSSVVPMWPNYDNVVNATQIGAHITTVKAQTGASKVHLVAHSMGGLSARYYLKHQGGLANVASYVAFGTPQHGNPELCALLPQICPTSAFMQSLNQLDDTPGTIAYTSIRSTSPNGDGPTGYLLDGGACLAQVAGGDHANEPTNAVIYATVHTALGGTCPGTYQNLPDLTP